MVVHPNEGAIKFQPLQMFGVSPIMEASDWPHIVHGEQRLQTLSRRHTELSSGTRRTGSPAADGTASTEP